MPMTTSNVPHLKGSAMADTRADTTKAGETKPAGAQAKAEKPAPQYARAAESGDPAVQKLLAEREAHLMNAQPDPSLAAQREAAEKAVQDIDKRLNDLGFTAE